MSKLRYTDIKSKERELLALTGLTVDEFEPLIPEFEKTFQAHMAEWRFDGQRRTKRKYTTYQNSPLPTAEDRLLFVLLYLKGNPLQAHHGVMFGMMQGKANRWLYLLMPLFQKTLRTLASPPAERWRNWPNGETSWSVRKRLKRPRRMHRSPFLS